MADKFYYLNEPIQSDGIALTYNPIYETREKSMLGNMPAPAANVGRYIPDANVEASSIEDLGDLSSQDWEENPKSVSDMLYENQSGLQMIGNALANNLVIATTSAVSGSIGLVDGLFETLYTGELNKLWNNATTNAMTDLQESAKEAMPIYRPDDYSDKSIVDKLGTGVFWADLVENLGFTEGMLIPGMGASKLLQSAPKFLQRIGGSFAGALGEASVEAVNAKNEQIKNKTSALQQGYADLVAQGQDVTYEDYLNDLTAIQEDAVKAGNFVFGTNVALLTASNAIEFGSLFERGFGTAKKLRRTVDGYSAVSLPERYARTLGKTSINATTEGLEEVAQKGLSETPNYYTDYNRFNNSIFNNDKQEVTNNILSSLGTGFANTLQDNQTAEEFAMGFITGLIGAPMLRKSIIPVKIENNVISGFIQDARDYKKETQLANDINTRLSDDKQVKAYYSGLVRHMAIQDDINTAIDEDNQVNYEDAKSAQFINDIRMFDEAGHLEHLTEIINNSVDTSDEGIKSLIDNSADNSAFKDNGNPISIQEARDLITKKQEKLNALIDTYKEAKDVYQQLGLDDESLDNAVFLNVQLNNNINRRDELISKISESLRTISKNSSVSQETSEALNKATSNPASLIEFLFKERATLNNAIEEARDVPINETMKLLNDANDLIKIDNNITTINSKLSEVIKDPNKSRKDREKAEKKEATKEAVKRNGQVVDKVSVSSVSDLVNEAKEGAIDLDDLESTLDSAGDIESLISGMESEEGEPSSQTPKQKVQEAKKVVKISTDIIAQLDKAAQEGKYGEQVVKDAKKKLEASTLASENANELLDLDSSAFADEALLYDESDFPSNISEDEIQEALAERSDNANSVLKEIISNYEEIQKELEDIDNYEVTTTLGEDVLKDAQQKEPPTTGQSEVSTTESANAQEDRYQEQKAKAKQASEVTYQRRETIKKAFEPFLGYVKQNMNSNNYPEALKAVVQLSDYIDQLKNLDASPKELWQSLNTLEEYNKYKHIPIFVKNIEAWINKPLNIKPSTKEESKKEISQEKPDRKANPLNPIITSEAVEASQENEDRNNTELGPSAVNGKYQYWRPNMTQYPIYGNRGEYIPFYITANTMKKSDGSPRYTKEELQEIEAVYKYLEEKGAFNRLNSNAVGKGTKVRFLIDPELNAKAGGVVVLIADEQGNIIGDLPSLRSSNVDNYVGLRGFLEKAQEEYEKTDKSSIYEIPHTSQVVKKYIGKVPYSKNKVRYSLSQLFKDIPFKLGISIGDSKVWTIRMAYSSSTDARTAEERSIKYPLSTTPGQPYLLLPTGESDSKYITVPFITPRIDNRIINSTEFGTILKEIITGLGTKPSLKQLLDAKNKLLTLLAIEDIYLNYTDGILNINVKINPGDKISTLYSGAISEEAANRFVGLPIQISRAHINGTIEGRDYNKILGDIIQVDLEPGFIQTINNFIVLNPIGESGEMLKAIPPKTLGSNINKSIAISFEGKSFKVNPLTWEVTGNTKGLNENQLNLIRAKAFGIHTGTPDVVEYNTEWGLYSPTKNAFVTPKEAKKEEHKKETKVEISELDIASKASKLGLLNKPVWKALSEEQKSALLKHPKSTILSKIDELEVAFDATKGVFNEEALGSSLDDFIKDKTLYRKTTEDTKTWDQEKEVSWLSKVLPQFSNAEHLQIVEGLKGLLLTEDGLKAYGKFKNGLITIGRSAAAGTLFHEAFHAVTHCLLIDEERVSLFKAAKEKYPNIETIVGLEEELAEDFRRYVLLEQTPIIGKAINLYRKLKHFITNLLGNESYLDKVFFDINNGNLSTRELKSSRTGTRYSLAEKLNDVNRKIENTKDKLTKAKAARESLLKLKGTKPWKSQRGHKFYIVSPTIITDTYYSSMHLPEEFKPYSDYLSLSEASYGARWEYDDTLLQQDIKSYEDALINLNENKDFFEYEQRTWGKMNSLDLNVKEYFHSNQSSAIQQQNSEALEFDRLSAEQQRAIMNGENGHNPLTREEYNKLTLQEKENLLYCFVD